MQDRRPRSGKTTSTAAGARGQRQQLGVDIGVLLARALASGPARHVQTALEEEAAWWADPDGCPLVELVRHSFGTRQVLRGSAHSGSWRNALSYMGTPEPADGACDVGGGLHVEAAQGPLGSFLARLHAAAPGIELTVEPGRFWLTDCAVLLTRVLDVKTAGGRTCLVLDLGLMSHLQWAAYLRLPALPPAAAPWRLVGRSCFEEDAIEDDEPIPVAAAGPPPALGDWFAIGNVTGYSLELACDFNGIRRPDVRWLAA